MEGLRPLPFLGKAMRGFIHEVDDKHERYVHVADKADIDEVAKHCADLRAIGAGSGKDDKLAMHADGYTIMEWCNKVGVTWRQFWNNPELPKRFIEDPDNAAFRVWTGKL